MSPRDTGSTVLLAAVPHLVGEPTASFDLAIPAKPSSVHTARQVARAWSRHCQVPDPLADTVQILVSELCTNAVLHGQHDLISVRGWCSPSAEIRFEVDDHSPAPLPAVQHPDVGAESGRGLLLVDVLVAELGGAWGFTADGACAWCCFALKPEGQ
ncbi:ATP-binding protein [Streptomyces adustus]|nr:ATP-binding protein [Streptomyces adustus]